uniref:Uncharacterized protein n=1 Tax=Anguilla anguilla TaxID=7936 RepID=A0A0E9XJS4_ANGAN
MGIKLNLESHKLLLVFVFPLKPAPHSDPSNHVTVVSCFN